MRTIDELNKIVAELKQEVSWLYDQDIVREQEAHNNEIERFFLALDDDQYENSEIDIEITRLQLVHSILAAEIKRRGLTQKFIDEVLKVDYQS